MSNRMHLQHHGIKGQKWGVRRFQNKDGSLTKAGEQRYYPDIQGAKEKVKKAKANQKVALDAYNKASRYGSYQDEKRTAKELLKSIQKTKWAKQDLQSEKIKKRLNDETKEKSKHRLKLEHHYLEKGMNQEEAEIAAYKRVITEKALAVTAGMTVTAAAAYVIYKGYDKRVDKIIESGTMLQNISNNSNKGVSDAFYASMNKMDNDKYRGIYGNSIHKTEQKVYETKISVNKNLKVASEKHAVDTISELVKNPDYAKKLEIHLKDSIGRYPLESQNNAIRKGLDSLKKGKIDSNVYKALNLSLVDHALPTSSDINKGFYDKLKSKGYDAIMDINDKKLSGYHSKNPIIVFNGQSKTSVNSIKEVGQDAINKAMAKGILDITVKELTPSLITSAASIGAIKIGSNLITSRRNDKIVREYRKKHPNSKLSYNEIIRNNKK